MNCAKKKATEAHEVLLIRMKKEIWWNYEMEEAVDEGKTMKENIAEREGEGESNCVTRRKKINGKCSKMKPEIVTKEEEKKQSNFD